MACIRFAIRRRNAREYLALDFAIGNLRREFVHVGQTVLLLGSGIGSFHQPPLFRSDMHPYKQPVPRALECFSVSRDFSPRTYAVHIAIAMLTAIIAHMPLVKYGAKLAP